jgi:phosphate-selective porin OprO/OprP
MKHSNISILCLASTLSVAITLAAAQGSGTLVALEPGKGVGFKSDDGNATLNIGGRIQVRHTYEENSDSSTFSVPRLRLGFKGSLYQVWAFEIQTDLAKKEKATLKDGFVERAVGESHKVRFGQFKTGFDRQQLESSGRQTFVDRNIVSDALGKARDVGLQGHGKVMNGKLQYNAGLFNGAGEGNPSPNGGHMAVARISLNPLGDFGLSQGGVKSSAPARVFVDLAAYHTQDESGHSLAGTTGLAAGAGLKVAGLYGAAEYIRRETDANVVSNGFYAQASYMILPEFVEAAARYAYLDPNNSAEDDLRTETTAGLNVFFEKAGHNLKLTIDASLLTDETKVGDDNHNYRTRAQVQLVF